MSARVITLFLAGIAAGLATPGLSQLGPQIGSQLGVPQVGQAVGDVVGSVGRTIDRATNSDLAEPVRSVNIFDLGYNVIFLIRVDVE